MAKRGRPSLLDDPKKRRALIGEVVDILEKGVPLSTALDLAGIAESTHYGWMQLGDEGIEPYADYSWAVTRARARGEVGLLERVRAHADEDGGDAIRAATWMLERIWPDKYGASLTLRKAHDDALRAVLTRLREGLDPETFARVLGLLTSEDREGDGSEPAVDVDRH